MKNNKPLIIITNPGFIIQTKENNFVFTEESDDEVTFYHIEFIEKENNISYKTHFFITRKISPIHQFPLVRIGQKFLIPSYLDNKDTASIYDADNKNYIYSILNQNEKLKIDLITIDNKKYFQITSKIIINTNNLETYSEEFISLLAEKESFPTYVFSISENKILPIKEQNDLKYILEYLNKRQEEYNYQIEQKIKIEQEACQILARKIN